MNLAQSLAGLAVQALNEGLDTEGVWINGGASDYCIYFKTLLQRLNAIKGNEYDVWEFVQKLGKKGVVKGYVLYDYSISPSVNIATVQAGLRKGVLVDITQEKKAKRLGLAKLFDATIPELTDSLNFEAVKEQLNNNLIVLIDPANGNNRDYAIAHKSMVYYGVDSFLNYLMGWVKPLSPVIGWNRGPEFEHIAPCTRYGLINTASDWCLNLSLLACNLNTSIGTFKQFDPTAIDWKSDKNYHAFVMSDGDNMQWTFGNFIHNPNYWANPYNAELSMGFTTCAVNISMAGNDALQELIRTQQPQVSVVEYGGGYYYPDLFAEKLPNRKELLRDFARTVNIHMKKAGVHVFAFICRNLYSKGAMEAYQIFAEELEDLTGMIAVQYAPYNGGNGDVFWVKNREGIEIPVLTAKNMVWANLSLERSGSPSVIADCINKVATTAEEDERSLGWTIVHAWSRFDRGEDGQILDAPQNNPASARGVTPLKWGKDLINTDTEVVSIEEVLWRIRMRHNPEQTKKIVENIKSCK
jgi:hypothetical protein